MEHRTAAAGWRAALASAAGAGAQLNAARPLAPGDPRTVGPYRIEAVLGQGGMGRVFLARDDRDEHAGPVAVKVLSRTGDATAWSRFRRELAAARRVEGEGTARILDGDADADPPWLAAEYIDGPTLDSLVAARGTLDVAAGAALAVGVAGALGEIHAAGVVHRDLKPANIILSAAGPKVVDFGIARTAGATTLSVTGWTMGTPGYMAPEQIAAPREVGPQADVFALGAVLVFAVTGSSPYAEGDPATVIYRIVHGEPQLGEVPAQLRELLASCLAREPEARPRVEAVAAAGLRILDELAALSLASTAVPSAVPPAAPSEAAAGAVSSESADQEAEPPAELLPPPLLPPVLPVDPFDPTRLTATGDQRRPARRLGRGALGLLAVLVAAVIGATSWFAVQALARPAPSNPAAAGTHSGARAGTSTGTARQTPAQYAGGYLLLGWGCKASKWGVFSITSPSLERKVGGGDPACGRVAEAFRKSGTAQQGPSSAVWSFDFKRAVTCSLRIYIADTAPSSGAAVYQVAAVGDLSRTVTIDQANYKGRYYSPPDLANLYSPVGRYTVTLTDISTAPNDQNHVTASSVAASCQVG